MDLPFKFAIGDLVYTKTAIHDMQAHLSIPRSLQITGRILDECDGGIQLHYTCANTGTAIRMDEDQLIAVEEAHKTVADVLAAKWGRSIRNETA